MKWHRLAMLLVVLAAAACEKKTGTVDLGNGSGDAADMASGPDGAAPALKAFGVACTADDQCTSQVCYLFGDGTQLCTAHCSNDSDCPTGSQGQKCNKQGYCRP